MGLLRLVSLPFYVLAMGFGLLSRLMRRIGTYFIQLGDYIVDHKRYTDAIHVRHLAEKWKRINDRVE